MTKNQYVALSFLLGVIGFILLFMFQSFAGGLLSCSASLVVIIWLMITGKLKMFG